MNTIKTFFLLMLLTGLLLAIGGAIGGQIGIIFALGLRPADELRRLLVQRPDCVEHGPRPARYAGGRPGTLRDGGRAGPAGEYAYAPGVRDRRPLPNAFATGRNPKNAAVAATTGIRRILTREELSAVMAHEMAHVGNRDTLIMTVVATIAGAISMLAFMAQIAALFGSFGGHSDDDDNGGGGGNIISLLIIAIVMPIAATIIRMAISRAREFQADTTGAHNCGDPDALARALEKLERGAEAQPLRVNEAASHLFIVNPLSGRSMARLFSTHPPIEERVRRLRNMTVRPGSGSIAGSAADYGYQTPVDAPPRYEIPDSNDRPNF